MSFLNNLLLAGLNGIYSFVNNYALAIILFTLLIKLVVSPLNLKSRRSTMRMSSLQPQMRALQEKYKGDQEKLNQKMQELYRKEGVNPVGGCLPMVVSMFVLFAMFYALRTFANERLVRMFLTFYHNPEMDPRPLADSFLWIRNFWMPDSPFATFMPDLKSLQQVDLSIWNRVSQEMAAVGTIPEALGLADRAAFDAFLKQVVTPFLSSEAYAPFIAPAPGLSNLSLFGLIPISIFKEANGFFVLPLVSVATQIVMQKLMMNQQAMDPAQAGSQKSLIWVMTFMSLYFCAIYNSAFALYWVVSNIYAILEQLYFNYYFKLLDQKSAKAREVGI